jgi:uncharacterized protein YgiM (DUF1202 family)
MTPARAATLDDRHTRRIIAVILIAGLLLAVLPSLALRDASAATVSVGESAVVTTNALNVRSGPGTAHAVVDRLSRGEAVTICAIGGGANGYQWVQVARIPGQPIGWAAADYLATGNENAPSGFTIGDRILVDAGALNFRTAPGTSATVIRALPYGTLLTITDGPTSANGYTWYQGKTTAATGGDIGWAIGQAMMRAPAEMPDPSLQFDPGASVKVNTGTLRLRGTPAMSGAILANLLQGTTLTVTGMPVGTWYPVRAATGTEGWVAGMYLAGGVGGAGNVTLAAGSPARVDVASLNFRTGPGLDAGIQGQLSRGTWLMLVSGPQAANGYEWYQVDTGNGVTGWVIGEALAPAS